MEVRPDHSNRSPEQLETSFIDRKDEKIAALQKMVDNLLLILALLAMAFLIAVSLLIFGATLDTLRLLLSGIIESIISVLLVFIFRRQLFGSLEKFPLQKDDLEQIGKVVDAQLAAISKKQEAADSQSTNIIKQMERQEKEFVSIKKMVERSPLSNNEHVARRNQLEHIEDLMSLTNTKWPKCALYNFHQSGLLPAFSVSDMKKAGRLLQEIK